MKYYTGIGSRATPDYILAGMTTLAIALADKGYILRSGGAPGADTAFEEGAGPDKEIFLPWRGFNGNPSPLTFPTQYAFEMAKKYHPAWARCRPSHRKLHARNCHEVLGPLLDTPSEFVLCWTKGGLGEGGTGQALRVAAAHSIPIYDFGREGDIDRFLKLLPDL